MIKVKAKRSDSVKRYVVVTYEGRVYGPFASRDEARRWRDEPHASTGDPCKLRCKCKVLRLRQP